MRSNLLAAIFMSCGSAALSAAQAPPAVAKIDSRWVYVNERLNWKRPPPGTAHDVEYSDSALLVIIIPSGDYIAVSPILYRNEKSKLISISRGDGMTIRKGQWRTEGDGSIRIVSRVVYTPLPESGKRYPYDEREEVWKPSGSSPGRIAGALSTPTQTFVPIQHFGDLEFLEKYIADETGVR